MHNIVGLLRSYCIPACILGALLISNFLTRVGPFPALLNDETMTISLRETESDDTRIAVDDESDEPQWNVSERKECLGPKFAKGKEYFEKKMYGRASEQWIHLVRDGCRDEVLLNNIGVACARGGDEARADSFFTLALSLDSTYSRAYFNRGRNNTRLFRWSKANRDYRRALALDSLYSSAAFNLGTLFLRLGELDSAQQFLSLALRSGHDKARTWHNLGVVFQRRDSLDAAVKAYGEAIRFSPGSLESRFNRAILFEKQGAVREAVKEFKKILSIEPGHYKTLVTLARRCMSDRDFSGARRLLDKLLSLCPGSVEVEYEQAKLFGMSGHNKQALELYRAIARSDPANPRVHYNIGVNLADLGFPEEAEASYLRAVSLDPAFWKARYNLGVHYLRSGRYERARSMLSRAVETEPQHIESHYNLGLALLKLDKKQEAQSSFLRVLALNSDHIESLYNLGYLSMGGTNDSADYWFEQVLKRKPGHEKSLFNLGVISLRAERYRRAAMLFRKALSEKPSYPEAYYNLALCYKRNGKYTAALEVLDSALGYDSSFANALLLKVDMYEKTGRDSLAIRLLTEMSTMTTLSIECMEDIARRCYRRDLSNAATALYRRVAARDSLSGEPLVELARIEFEGGLLDSAATHVRSAIERAPDKPTVWKLYADILYQSNRPRAAVKALRTVIELAPDHEEGRALLAGIYEKEGKFEKAAHQHEALFRLRSSYNDALAAADAFLKADVYIPALTFYRKAMTIDSSQWRPLYYSSLLLDRLDSLDAARESWNNFLIRFPDDHRGYYQLGKIARENGEWEKARTWFMKALERQAHGNSFFYRAEAAYRLGKYAEAHEAISAFLKLEPESGRGKRLADRIGRKYQERGKGDSG